MSGGRTIALPITRLALAVRASPPAACTAVASIISIRRSHGAKTVVPTAGRRTGESIPCCMTVSARPVAERGHLKKTMAAVRCVRRSRNECVRAVILNVRFHSRACVDLRTALRELENTGVHTEYGHDKTTIGY